MLKRFITHSFFVAALSALAVSSFFAFRVYAAEISGVRISDITEGSATIEWNTDVETDATVYFGLDPRVGTVRYPAFDKKEHSLTIDELDPSTTYHFRVQSTDVRGNKSTTAGFVFTTESLEDSPVKNVKDPEQRAVAERIINDLDKITDPTAIIEIGKKVEKVAGEILKPPTIMGLPRVDVDTTSAVITWTTDRESNSMVYLASEADFGQSDYPIAQGDPNEQVKVHRVNVIGLDPATTYHFKVVSEDTLGLKGETEDDTFKTKSILPRVTNVQVTRVQEKSALVSWQTSGVLARGIVEYTNMRTRATKVAGSSVFALQQSVQLSDLEFGTRYSAVIRAVNEAGEESSSAPFQFVTIRDVIAPAISKVKNESTLFPGEEVKIQTIIGWETDEPAICQVFYSQGLVREEGSEGESMPIETNPVTLHTQVIVGFASATVYQFWMKCSDESGNESRSEDFVLITPIKEKSIIDVILENFQGTFGWVNNIGK